MDPKKVSKKIFCPDCQKVHERRSLILNVEHMTLHCPLCNEILAWCTKKELEGRI
jgi:endogenous inhibitor of DNA gyrase (YacG/DUF329 family)